MLGEAESRDRSQGSHGDETEIDLSFFGGLSQLRSSLSF